MVKNMLLSLVQSIPLVEYRVLSSGEKKKDGDEARATRDHHLPPLQHHQVHLDLSSGTGVTENTNLPQIHSLFPRCGQKT